MTCAWTRSARRSHSAGASSRSTSFASEQQPSPKQLLTQRGVSPRKRLGQHFLVEPRFAARVAAAIPPGSFIVEIGAGTGSLTQALAASARRVVALELDRALCAILAERFAGSAVVEVVQADALEFDLAGALVRHEPPRAVCGNLPYYITTPLIERALEAAALWDCALMMVQREYARRMTASPGTADYGSLSVFVGYHCRVETLFEIGAGGFYPPPAVASSVVRLTPRLPRALAGDDEAYFLRLIRAAFAQRRKMLANAVAAGASDYDLGVNQADVRRALAEIGLEPGIRAERLSVERFVTLARLLRRAAGANLH